MRALHFHHLIYLLTLIFVPLLWYVVQYTHTVMHYTNLICSYLEKRYTKIVQSIITEKMLREHQP